MAITKKLFAFAPGEPGRVMAQWEPSWKNFRLAVDGVSVAEIPDGKRLADGFSVPLPDGAKLKVGLGGSGGKHRLLLSRDGMPLPGAGLDLVRLTKTAARAVLLVAGVNLVAGVLSFLGKTWFPSAIGGNAVGGNVGWLAAGAVFAILGFLMLRRSLIAAVLAAALIAVDGVFLLKSGRPNVVGLVVRVAIEMLVCTAIPAIRQLGRIARWGDLEPAPH